MDGKFTPLGADGNLYRLRTNWLSSTSCSDWVFPHEERQGLLQFLLGPCNFVGLSCTLLVSVSHQHSRFQGIHGVHRFEQSLESLYSTNSPQSQNILQHDQDKAASWTVEDAEF